MTTKLSVSSNAERHVELSNGQSNQEQQSSATIQPSLTTDVVIPSNLLSGLTAGPYSTSVTQDNRENASQGDTNRFDVRTLAQVQMDSTKFTLARSTSISLGGLHRSRVTGHDTRANDFVVSGERPTLRRTSGAARIEMSYGSQSTLRGFGRIRRESLPLIIEGQIHTNHQRRASRNDYFGNYAFRSRNALVSGRSSLDTSASPADPSPFQQLGHRSSSLTPTGRSIPVQSRHSTPPISRRNSLVQRSASIVAETVQDIKQAIRRSSLHDVYERAKQRGVDLQRNKWVMLLFEYTFYVILISFVYFVLVGVPLWKGAVFWLYWVFQHKFAVAGTWSVTIGIAFFYAYSPLLIFFEEDPPMPEDLANIDPTKTPGVHNTALMIPCYKSAKIIGPTLEAAIKIFPPSHIFVIANGNSPTPLDDTEAVCRPYGVNHVWSPVGSKIVAQFVGCYAAKGFQNVLLIDDDCALPPNFPIVSDRMTKDVKCIGYTIKSVGPNSSKGTFCQQAQDLEYKISGIQRALAGKMGSATFPHGAISLWDLDFLVQTFHKHPGFSVSEDWFFGHVARQLGSRIKMCTSVFIETETPSAVFFSSGGARGGFGEMTIYKQRFLRWNFFFVNGMYYNMAYIIGSWKLGFWEIGAKLFVFQEVYETLLYLLSPFVLPISIIVRPAFFGYLFAGTFVLYFINVVIFNELHLRLKRERVSSATLYLYYMPYKIVLTLINVGSCYWSIYKYARYFAKRHPKIIEDEKAVDVVLRMEETKTTSGEQGRRMTVTAVGAQIQTSVLEDTNSGPRERKMTVTTIGPKIDPLSPILENREQDSPVITFAGERVSFGSSRRGTETSTGIPRLSRQSSRGESPGGHAEGAESPTRPSSLMPPELAGLGLTNLNTRSRSSDRGSRRSESLRRSGSLPRSIRQNNADFDSPSFGDLMDRLALIEQRLNAREVESVDVRLETPAPTDTAVVDFGAEPRYFDDSDSSDSNIELEELKKEVKRKTDDSISMV